MDPETETRLDPQIARCNRCNVRHVGPCLKPVRNATHAQTRAAVWRKHPPVAIVTRRVPGDSRAVWLTSRKTALGVDYLHALPDAAVWPC
jgi:hypothetical protein